MGVVVVVIYKQPICVALITLPISVWYGGCRHSAECCLVQNVYRLVHNRKRSITTHGALVRDPAAWSCLPRAVPSSSADRSSTRIYSSRAGTARSQPLHWALHSQRPSVAGARRRAEADVADSHPRRPPTDLSATRSISATSAVGHPSPPRDRESTTVRADRTTKRRTGRSAADISDLSTGHCTARSSVSGRQSCRCCCCPTCFGTVATTTHLQANSARKWTSNLVTHKPTICAY